MAQYYRVRNWAKFQHYKNRNPPWVKFHLELFDSEDWVLNDDAGKFLILLCIGIAAKFDGKVPADPSYLRRKCGLAKPPNLKPLIDCGFLELEVYASNHATLQANACPEKESETDTESEKEAEKESISAAPEKALALVDDPVLITFPTNRPGQTYGVLQSKFDQMQALYPALDIAQELRAMAGWLISNPKNAKTLSGMPRFINGWLAKNQNRSRADGHGKPSKNDNWLAGAADLAAELRADRA